MAALKAYKAALAQGATGDAVWFGALRLGPWQLHPLALLYLVSGSLMISKTLRIPKLEGGASGPDIQILGARGPSLQ